MYAPHSGFSSTFYLDGQLNFSVICIKGERDLEIDNLSYLNIPEFRTRRGHVDFLGAITSRWPACFISRPLLPPPDEPAASTQGTRKGGDSKSDDITRIATNLTRSRAAASMVLQISEIFSPDSLQFAAADSVCSLAMLGCWLC